MTDQDRSGFSGSSAPLSPGDTGESATTGGEFGAEWREASGEQPTTTATGGLGQGSSGRPASTEPTSTGRAGTGQAAKDEATHVAQSAASNAQDVAGVARDRARDVTSTAKEQARSTGTEAKQQARTLYEQGRREISDQAGKQQERLAGGMRSVSSELSSMADASQEQGLASTVTRQVADYLGRAGVWLEDRDPSQVMDEVSAYARRHPVSFMAIAAGLGLLVGRVARGAKDASSAEDGTADLTGGATTSRYGADEQTGVSSASTGAAYPTTAEGMGETYAGTAATAATYPTAAGSSATTYPSTAGTTGEPYPTTPETTGGSPTASWTTAQADPATEPPTSSGDRS
jgi:ElaB/YqjD/DUF883 family membrane-anchored ribosome-binding protein